MGRLYIIIYNKIVELESRNVSLKYLILLQIAKMTIFDIINNKIFLEKRKKNEIQPRCAFVDRPSCALCSFFGQD